MQLALAESPACHSPFPNIFCNTPNPMIYGYLQTGDTISVKFRTPRFNPFSDINHCPVCISVNISVDLKNINFLRV